MAISQGSNNGPSSEINVTPLVDVCLVLLIIFMVMIPKSVPEISVRVPPDKPNGTSEGGEPLVLSLSEDGAMALNDRAVATRGELGELLSNQLLGRDKKVVFVDFADDASYGEAVAVLEVAKQSGAAVLGVVRKRARPTPATLIGI